MSCHGGDIALPCNHDQPMRQLCGLVLPCMRFRRRTVHTMLDGRRLLVVLRDTKWQSRDQRTASPIGLALLIHRADLRVVDGPVYANLELPALRGSP